MTDIMRLYAGYAVPIAQPIPRGVAGYNPNLQPYSYDLTLSESLLTKMGHPNGQGIPTLDMYYPTDIVPANLVAQYVQGQLAKIGITVKLTGMGDSPMEDYFAANNPPSSPGFPIFTFDGWSNPPDPQLFADWLIGPLCYNYCNSVLYNSTTVNTLLHEADVATDETLRLALYMNASQVAYNDIPYIWMGQIVNATIRGPAVVANNVRGFGMNLEFYGTCYDLSQVYFTSQGETTEIGISFESINILIEPPRLINDAGCSDLGKLQSCRQR